MKKNQYISFKNPDTGVFASNDPDCEGRVDRFDRKNQIVFVTNLNMPFCGSFVMQPISVSAVVYK